MMLIMLPGHVVPGRHGSHDRLRYAAGISHMEAFYEQS